jgi:hypothetical protein
MTFRTAPVTTTCNVVACAVFGAAAVLTATLANAKLIHPLLFAMGAIGFATNLRRTLDPIAAAVAKVAQFACLVEFVGFTVGMTTMWHVGTISAAADHWWVSAALWGLLTICFAGFVLSAVAGRSE